MNTSTLDLLCMLGDKAVYVLMLMISIGQPVTQRRLEAVTLYSPNTVTKCLAKLNEHRLVSRTHPYGAWASTQYGQQLRLGETLHNESSIIEDSPLTTTTTTTLQTEKDKGEVVVVADSSPQFEDSHPQVKPSYPQVGPTYPQLVALGIGHTVALELAALPHVTPDYLTALIADWRSDTPRRRRTAGMLIHRIREADQPPPTSAHTDDNNRYLSWLE